MSNRSNSLRGSKQPILVPINAKSISIPGRKTLALENSMASRHSKSSPMIVGRTVSPVMNKRAMVSANRINENPFVTEFAYREQDCIFPMKMLYEDYLCTDPRISINLAGWYLAEAAFRAIAEKNTNIKKLNIEYCQFDPDSLNCLKGLKRLTEFSMQGTCTIDVSIVKVFASWPLLMNLNISECAVNVEVFRAMSLTCKRLKHLNISRCSGLNDFCLQEIANCMIRFRFLRSFDFSHCTGFTDEGMLTLLNAGPSILTSIKYYGCKCIGSLSIAGLRKKMSTLETLDVSNMELTQSAFEWISEGCRMLRVLNCTKCLDLDDVSLPLLGARCIYLENLNLTKCTKITDLGFVGFFEAFEGSNLKVLCLNECIQFMDASVLALSKKAAHELVDLRMNGLSQITANALNILWGACKKLQHFEIRCELKVTATHRKSLMPHMSDSILRCNEYSQLVHVNLSGACMLSDVGGIALVEKCHGLASIDVSCANGISDKFVLHISAHAQKLTALVLSGCIKVTDIGVCALAKGVASKRIKKLELNGCPRVTDLSVLAIAYDMRQMEILGLRACDRITEASLIELAAECYQLRSLDISGLDMVGIKAISFIVRKHKYLYSLHCQSCNITNFQFNTLLKNASPLVQPVPRSCHMQLRSRVVREYNQYVLKVRHHRNLIKMIQKLFLGNHFNVFMRLYHDKLREAATKIQSSYRAIVVKRKFDAMKYALVLEYRNSCRLQKQMRRLVAVRHARKKASYLRWHWNARVTLQRVYRGYRVRKRVRWMFRRLWSYYRKIGHLAHKLRIISDARRLHKQIVKVQSVFRMFLMWLRYHNTLQGFMLFQQHIRDWQFRKWVAKTHMVSMIFGVERLVVSAATIQRNWKAFRFNAIVVPFTLYCAVEFNRLAMEDDWFATCIQRRWRGHNCRTILNLPMRRFNAARLLQATYRGYKLFKNYPKYRKYVMILIRRWRRILLSIPTLEKGKWVKRIQRKFRIYRFMCQRHSAAERIAKRYRIYFAHCVWAAILLDKRENAALRITRCIRIVACRHIRFVQHMRFHMAAFVIQYLARSILTQESKKRIKYATAIRVRKEALEEKQALAHKRRMKAVNKIIARWKQRMASRIQRVYNKWIYEKHKREEVRQNRMLLRQEVAEELTNIKRERKAAAGFDPTVLIGKAASTISKFITGSEEIVSVKDRIRCLNSVLVHQTLSIEQEGILDFHLTQGEQETMVFLKEQLILKNTGCPYFERVDRDLSGSMALEMYVWCKRGTGVECICEVDIKMKPVGCSNMSLHARQSKLVHECVKLAWHKDIHIEIQGKMNIKLGVGGFAVRDIVIVYDTQEAEEYVEQGYQLVKDLRQYGLTSAVYYYSRKPVDDDNVYEMKTLNMFDWMDKRLIRCIQVSVKNFSLVNRCFTDSFELI